MPPAWPSGQAIAGSSESGSAWRSSVAPAGGSAARSAAQPAPGRKVMSSGEGSLASATLLLD
jgi:hypothetical protein